MQYAGRIGGRTGTSLSVTLLINSSKGLVLALLVTGCGEQVSGYRGNSAAGYARSGESGTTGRDCRCLWDLWAKHPAIAGGSVQHVQAVSSRVTPSPPSRRQAVRSPAPTTPFTTVPGTQKALSLPGKGPDLRKLVAGAGFEPATSGL